MDSHQVVLLVGPFPPPRGGVAAINELIYKNCNRQRCRIISLNSAEYKHKYRITSVTGFLNLFFQFKQICKFVMLVIQNKGCIIHIAVSSYYGFYKSSLFILIGAILKKKIIFHLHGGAFEKFYVDNNRLIRRYIRFIFNKSDLILTLAEYWYKIVTEIIQVAPAKVQILHNCYGVEFNQLPISNAELEIERGKESLVKILYVGALSQKKGVLDLIEICAEIKKQFTQFILYIAGGEKEPGILTKIRQAILYHDLTDQIQLVGEVANQKKLDYFLKSQLFVLPSYVENLPIALLEAMRAGMSIISTPVGAIPEIIKENENGFLIPAGDLHQFASKIIQLCNDKSIRDSMSQKNLRQALNYFDPETYIARLINIYKDLGHG